MLDVTITGINMANGKPNRAGKRIIAFFDCRVRGLQLNGCALVRTARDGLAIWPPKVEGPEAAPLGRHSRQPATERILTAARETYRAVRGSHTDCF